MTKKSETAIAALDAVGPGTRYDGTQRIRDPEGMHVEADEIILGLVPPEVREAYERVVDRAGDWWYA